MVRPVKSSDALSGVTTRESDMNDPGTARGMRLPIVAEFARIQVAKLNFGKFRDDMLRDTKFSWCGQIYS